MGKTVEERLKAVEQNQSIQDQLADREGFLSKMEESLKNVQGKVQQLDAGLLSATNAARQFYKISQELFGGLSEQIINYEESVRQAVAGNEKLVGTLISNRKGIQDLGKETAKFGVATSENLKVAREFGKENIKLLSIYRDNIKGLVDYTARMTAFEFKIEESRSLINKLTTVLDLNGDQLDVSRRKMVSFATQTGQSVSEVMQSYGKSIGSFMDFLNPEEMDKSFMQFQVMARRMGTEADTLYQMALKFDTLEGAQTTGARLNQTFSALGLEFNSLAVQEMEPQERIQYMADKTREALSRARQMGGKEGRLIMASLREAGLGSNEMIRALEAEGGMRRATGFEMGAALPAVSREQEAALARRLNAGRVTAAEAEERAQSAVRQTKSYAMFEESVRDFGGTILRLEETIAPIKQAYLNAKAKQLDQVLSPTLQQLSGIITGTGQITPEAQQVLSDAGMQNVKTFKEFFQEINNLDPSKIEQMFKNNNFIEEMAKSMAGAAMTAAKEAQNIIKMGGG